MQSIKIIKVNILLEKKMFCIRKKSTHSDSPWRRKSISSSPERSPKLLLLKVLNPLHSQRNWQFFLQCYHFCSFFQAKQPSQTPTVGCRTWIYMYSLNILLNKILITSCKYLKPQKLVPIFISQLYFKSLHSLSFVHF